MIRMLGWFLAVAAHGVSGVVSGVVLDFGSGRPLARTSVTIEPLPGTSGLRAITVRSGRSGHFSFDGVAAGMYRLYAQRRGFVTTFHGQRRPEGQGAPLEVTRDSSLFSELRLRRMGAITGSVLDENGIGLAGATVIAYRARLPLRPAGTAVADDRGVYRLGGLASGKYWVRSGPMRLEDGSGRIPTFGPQTQMPRDARLHQVRFDSEAIAGDIHPDEGSLFSVGGSVTCHLPGPHAVVVTLSSETGRQTQQTVCAGVYSFAGLAPGDYEISASYTQQAGGAFAEFALHGDTKMPLQLGALPSVDFNSSAAVKLFGRRADLAGTGDFREISQPRANLEPGYWELYGSAGDGRYIEAMRDQFGGGRRSRRPGRVYEFFEIYVDPQFGQRVRIVDGSACEIAGSVKRGGEAVPGAPVFLWPVGEDTRRQNRGWRMVIAGAAGEFQFANLPPGEYRILATFDASEASPELMDEAEAKTIRLEAGQMAGIDPVLWLAP